VRYFTQATGSAGYSGSGPVSAWPVTLACWFRPRGFDNDPQGLVVPHETTNVNAFGLGIWDGGSQTPQLCAFGAGTLLFQYGGGLTQDVLYHAAVVFTGTSTATKLYLNGAKVTGGNAPSFPSVDGLYVGDVLIGASERFADCEIGEVVVYTAALSDDEVWALSRGYTPMSVRRAEASRYWPIFGNDSPERDSSAAGASLTMLGSPIAAKVAHPPLIYPSRPKVAAFHRSTIVGVASSVAVAVAVPDVVLYQHAAAVSVAVGVPAHILTQILTANAVPLGIAVPAHTLNPVATAIGIACAVPAHALLEEGIAHPLATGIGVEVPAHVLRPGPETLRVALEVPAAMLVEGPRPVALALEVPAALLYQGAFTIPIAVDVSPATVRQTVFTSAVAVALGVPTTFLQEHPALAVSVAGVDRRIRQPGFTLTEALNHEADSASFRVDGFTPQVGHSVYITLGDDLVFGGSIRAVTQVYEGDRPALVAFDVDAQDHGRLLDRRLVNAQYVATAGDVIARDLVTRFSSGFTTTHVVSGLPVVDEIQFTDESLSSALTRVAQRIGGYWYVDPTRDVHLFLSETDLAPDAISSADPATATDIVSDVDVSQVRTKVVVEGGGSVTAAAIVPGAQTMVVDDAAWYSGTGGLVKVGTQRIAYGGVVGGGGATTVRSMDAPVGAPFASLAGGGGGVLGTTRYRVSFATAAGETTPGPLSNAVTGIAFDKPQSPVSFSSTGANTGPLVGTFAYVVTNVTNRGETEAGPSASFTVPAFASPAQPSSATVVTSSDGNAYGSVSGTVNYTLTFVTPYGETIPSAARTVTVPLHKPQTPGLQSVFGGPPYASGAVGSSLTPNYQWCVTNVTATGETLGSDPVNCSGQALPFYDLVSLSAPSVVSDGTNSGDLTASATYQYWTTYRCLANGLETARSSARSIVVGTTQRTLLVTLPAHMAGFRRVVFRSLANQSTPYLLAEVDDAGAATVRDGAADSTLKIGAAVSPARAGRPIDVVVRAGPSGTLARRVYRTKAVGTSGGYFLLMEVPGNAVAVIRDITADEDLGVPLPLSSDIGGQVSVAIWTGPAGTTGRRLYRDGHRIADLTDNTATSVVDSAPAATAATGASPPATSTAGGSFTLVVQSIPGGPPGTTARRHYRSKAGGGGQYFLAAQVDGNAPGATVADTKLDSELGIGPPSVNTAGGSSVNVFTIPLGGSGTTARRLYRLDAAGVTRLVAEIPNNTTTTFLDDLADKELGEVAPTVGTVGALAGATSLLLETGSGFNGGGGWVHIGNQLIRYGAVSGCTLTGIPSSGTGSIATALRVGTEVLMASMLTGIPSSGTGSIQYPIKDGEPVNVLVERADAAAQVALAALEGGDGVHEHKIADGRLSIQGATDRADAELALYATPLVTVTYRTRDPKTRPGRTVTFALGPPTNLVGSFKIQRVSRSELGLKSVAPLCDVTASTVKFSLEDVLRRVVTQRS